MIRTIIKQGRMVVAAGLFISVITASTMSTGLQNTAYAAAMCDKVNIVYCGLDGGTASSYANAFKQVYAANKSGHKASPSIGKDYTDIRDVYAWAGATGSMVNGMSTTNTKLGTLYRDGRIVVDGKTVATDSWVTARFSEGAGFVKIADGVYARKTTTSFQNPSAKVIVYMNDGQAVFAVMVECANAVKFTPVKKTTPPKTPETPTTPEAPQTPVVTPVSDKPAELPKTGVGSMAGLVAGFSIAGTAAHQLVSRRRR